ncbi:matrixin family metalloprotease [Paracoccus tegillarcae]|uniref:Peptidase metallopeptidase domain-containing protein n=1 Tax=Paracoccus tegillarcae TaxID=1529068 RepID=A0A2K9F5S9_9RHOB|nr:matrixin family metalloprotease [Paracoccus tegillarcae]AUH34541.1 hypothetical protein CUV01_15150 [Paracoccus tegillarcae]
MPYVSDFTALTTGESRWNKADRLGTPTVVTYTFLDNGELPSLREHPPAYFFEDNVYRSMTGHQRGAVNKALDHYEAETGLVFVEVSDPEDASIKFLANRSTDDSATSWAYFPDTTTSNGDAYLGSVYATITFNPDMPETLDWSAGGPLYTLIVHEIGHAVGLEHPHDGMDDVYLTASKDNHDHTIMSYNWEWEGDATGRSRDTLAPLDLDALHYLYGEDADFSATWNAAGGFLVIAGTGGSDAFTAGRAPSLLRGGAGNDRITGAQFNDTLLGGVGDDRMDGGAGSDRLYADAGADRVYGGGAADTLTGGNGADYLHGQQGNDLIYGDEWGDTLIGAMGDDKVYGGAGNDLLTGDSGDDSLFGNIHHDTLRGGAGDDRLWGEQGADVLYGGDGHDSMFGGYDDDWLFGEFGDDLLDGGGGADALFGGDGYDRLLGRAGHDSLTGGNGSDILDGGDGRDRLNGQAGNDILRGGSAADVFVFGNGSGMDRIVDWQNGVDQIDLGGVNGFDDFSNVSDSARQNGDNVIIDLTGSSRIVIENAQLWQLDEGDFIF